MKKDIQVATPQTPVDEETLRKYLFWLDATITEKQQNLFLQVAKANNLNPFKREIYAVGYGDNFSIITWYQVYIDKANGTGLLDGWEVEAIKDESGKVTGAKLTVYRKDWKRAFKWEASVAEFTKTYFDKFSKTKKMVKNWAEMPEFMIKKVVIGQGFRLCFPWELGGLPYLAEEITHNRESDLANIEVVVVEDEKKPEPAPEATKTETPATEVPATVAPETPEIPIGEAMGQIADETIAEMEKSLTDEDVVDDEVTRLPAPKVKEVQSSWKKYAEHNGWNFEDSEKKRKATFKKYYNVEEPKDLTVEQADELITKISNAMKKPVVPATPETK